MGFDLPRSPVRPSGCVCLHTNFFFSKVSSHHLTSSPSLPQIELPPIPPPFSCRAGLDVCLVASTDGGPEPRPYRITVKPRRRAGEISNIIMLEKSDMEKVGNQ